jgi:hypothetical protein
VPDPKSHAASLSWTLPDGRIQSPQYTASAIGVSISILACVFGGLAGFYFVAGSVRRDRERSIGAILAATPLSKTAYLSGKFASHVVFLLVVTLMAQAAGLVAFIRFGVGAFSPFDYFLPTLLLAVPAIAAAAAGAVLFDVTPGLSGRGGPVVWFFAFFFALVFLPMQISGGIEEGKPSALPWLDPAGLATHQWLVRSSVPFAEGMTSGYVVHDKPVERVAWKGIALTWPLVAARAANLIWPLLLLAAAVLVFDRFDHARRRRGRARHGLWTRLAGRFRRRGLEPAGDEPGTMSVDSLSPVSARPTLARAAAAEARLVWVMASWIKWPLALASLLAGLLPGDASAMAAAGFFVLLVPVISEVAARETLAGTRGLVFSQPGVPRSPVLWKAAAVALFLLVAAAPAVLRAFVSGPARGGAFVAGLLFVAGASVGMGSLTGGGKLFSGAFLALWFIAINRAPFADFAGVFAPGGPSASSLAYLALGCACLVVAFIRERLAA